MAASDSVGADFAALMNSASTQAGKEAKDYGYTVDRETGQRRPKKAAGRPRKNPPPQVEDTVSSSDGVPQEHATDPEPGWWTDGKIEHLPTEVSKKVKDEISGFAGLIVLTVGPVLVRSDPYCGGAFVDHSQAIVDAAIPLLCRSEMVVKFFSDTSARWMEWVALAIALRPVGEAVIKHHITHSVKIVEQGGEKLLVPQDWSEYPTDEPVAA